MVKCSRKGFAISDLWVSAHDKLSDFHLSSWQRGESPLPMLVVRLVLASIATGILIWSLASSPSPFWMIYLTNWGLLLVTTMTLSGLFVSIMAICNKLPDGAELPWYVNIYWFMCNVTITIAIIITILYWILLYDPEQDEENVGGFWLDLATHGFNSCIAVLELLSTRTPVRLQHFYQPLGIGLWYAAFSGVYYAAGGTDGNGNPFIYEVLDWREGSRAGAVVAASAAGVIIVYILTWGASICRENLSLATVRTTSHNLPFIAPDHLTRIA